MSPQLPKIVTDSLAREIKRVVSGRSWSLVTSNGWHDRGVVESIKRECGAPQGLSNVPSNPRVSQVLEIAAGSEGTDIIVALGGGSVMDAAKAISAIKGARLSPEELQEILDGQRSLPENCSASILAIPTTSGSGSEATCWATLWGDDEIKYSLSDRQLFPRWILHDWRLCSSMPEGVTIYSAMDAFSHALESLWNINATGTSRESAESAVSLIIRALPQALADPFCQKARVDLQRAAFLAGKAISITKTALAHSLSYPLTAKFAIPHGIACSFVLPEVMRFNLDAAKEDLAGIATVFGCGVEQLPREIEGFMDSVNFRSSCGERLQAVNLSGLGNEVLNPARAGNNVRSVSQTEAHELMSRSLNYWTQRPE